MCQLLLKSMAITALVTMGAQLCSQEAPLIIGREQLAGATLVRASVVGIERGSPFHRATFSVQEVLAGKSGTIGDHFFANVSPTGQANQGLLALHPPLERCQVMVWLVDKNDGRLRSLYRANLGLRFAPRGCGPGTPFRESDQHPETSSAVALCNSIRKVAQEDSNRRWELLEALCKDDEPLIAGWAMSVLASVDKDAAQPFLQQLAAENTLPEKHQEMIQDLLRQLADD